MPLCHLEPVHEVTIQDWLTTWSFDPVVTGGVVCAGMLYATAWRRVRASAHGSARALSRARAWCFAGGLLALVVSADGPPDGFADVSFSVHMVQHVLLQMVAAPLILLGGPVTLLLRADPPWLPRRVLVGLLRSRAVAVVTHPVVAFGAFTFVLVATHLTGFYELALQHEPVHEVEHLVYLATALLFWWPAIGIDPAPHRIGHLFRLLYLMISMPVPAFLGLAIANAGRVLYSSYAQPTPWGATALADQQAAGTLMWVAGMFTTVPAIGVVLMRWLDDESRRGARSSAPPAGHHLAGVR